MTVSKAKKKQIKSAKIQEIQRKAKKQFSLKNYNAENSSSDLILINRLSGLVGKSTLDWIETTMYQLRESANKYEKNLAAQLFVSDVKFVHQCPFVFPPHKIYFADFYLPKYRTIIEVDGGYHLGRIQYTKDKDREEDFNRMGIRVVRLVNEELKVINEGGRAWLRLRADIPGFPQFRGGK